MHATHRPLVLLLALSAGAAHAHGGGLDRHGCHQDRRNGDYHCHRAPGPGSTPAPAPPTPRQQLQGARSGPQPTRISPATPQGAFRNCSEARAAGAAPVHRGDPGYGPHLDRDNDGVGCEPYRGR